MTPRAVAAVVALALAVRVAAAVPIRFPALDDPAFHLIVARNLAQSRGLVIDAIWSYLTPFPTVTHPSNEYWMPLTALVLAPVFWLNGPDFRAAQALGIAAGALLVVPAMATAATLAPEGRRALAVIAGVAAALNPLLIYQSIVPDSAVVFAVTAGAALGFAGTLAAPPFIVGALTGLAYLARADGLLLAPVLLGYTLRARGRAAAFALTAGFLLAAGPWWVRQLATFGTPFPVGGVVLALVPDYATLFSWPALEAAELLRATSALDLLRLRAAGLAHNVTAVATPVLGGLLPFVLVALPAALRGARLQPALAAAGVLFVGSALLFPVAAMHGTFYHSFGAVLPALIGIGTAGLARAAGWWDRRRGWKHSLVWPLAAGVLALTAAQSVFLMVQAAALHARWEGQFAAAGRWLAQQPPAPVMTTQPHSLHYAAGVPAVMLPAAQPPDVALAVARSYGARYLVLTERFGRYPDALEPTPPGFRLAHDGDGILVYEVTPP